MGFGERFHQALSVSNTAAPAEIRISEDLKKCNWTPQCFEEIANMSRELCGLGDNVRLVGIGHSPSYVIEGCSNYSKKENLAIETENVPFSKRFLVIDNSKSSGEAGEVDELTYRHPTFRNFDLTDNFRRAMKDNRDQYRHYLEKKHNLSPQIIVDNFIKKGQKTAIVDRLEQGESLASFLLFIHTWAKDSGVDMNTFSNAMQTVVLWDYSHPNVLSYADDDLHIKVDKAIRLSRDLIHAMQSDEEDVRMVPSYGPRYWYRPPKRPEGDSKLVREIKAGIKAAVKAMPSRSPSASSNTLFNPNGRPPLRDYGVLNPKQEATPQNAPASVPPTAKENGKNDAAPTSAKTLKGIRTALRLN